MCQNIQFGSDRHLHTGRGGCNEGGVGEVGIAADRKKGSDMTFPECEVKEDVNQKCVRRARIRELAKEVERPPPPDGRLFPLILSLLRGAIAKVPHRPVCGFRDLQ